MVSLEEAYAKFSLATPEYFKVPSDFCLNPLVLPENTQRSNSV